MEFHLAAPLGAVLLLGLAGCQTPRDVARPQPRPLGEPYRAYRPPADRDVEEAVADAGALSPVPTLHEALSHALLHNPRLQVFAWDVRVREADALQAGLPPNPEIEAEVEEFGGTGLRSGAAAAEAGLVVGQLVELGGDRAARRRVAERAVTLAGWDYEAVRLDVLTETTQAFVATLAAQERLELSDGLLVLAEQFAATVADRADAGKVSPLEATRASIVRSNAAVARAQAARDLATARLRLAGVLGVSDPTFAEVAGDLGAVAPPPPASALRDLLDRNPDVARWDAEMALREDALDLERARRIPDVSLRAGPAYFNETGEVAFRAGLAVPMPLLDRNQGAIQAARARIRQGEAARRAAHTAAEIALATAYGTLSAAHAEAQTLAREVLPAAREAFEATQEGYREGKFDLLTVLDAQRTLFEVTNQHLDVLATYHRARAEVERLIATPLHTLPD